MNKKLLCQPNFFLTLLKFSLTLEVLIEYFLVSFKFSFSVQEASTRTSFRFVATPGYQVAQKY